MLAVGTVHILAWTYGHMVICRRCQLASHTGTCEHTHAHPCIQVTWTGKDGQVVSTGQVFGTVRGSAASILVAERVVLNFMQVDIWHRMHYVCMLRRGRGLGQGGILLPITHMHKHQLSLQTSKQPPTPPYTPSV